LGEEKLAYFEEYKEKVKIRLKEIAKDLYKVSDGEKGKKELDSRERLVNSAQRNWSRKFRFIFLAELLVSLYMSLIQ
jgi:hypothetical protein